MGVLIGSAVVPVSLALFWKRLSSKGMILGAISGTVTGVSSWLIVSSTYDGGLSNFFENTGDTHTVTILTMIDVPTFRKRSQHACWEFDVDLNRGTGDNRCQSV